MIDDLDVGEFERWMEKRSQDTPFMKRTEKRLQSETQDCTQDLFCSKTQVKLAANPSTAEPQAAVLQVAGLLQPPQPD